MKTLYPMLIFFLLVGCAATPSSDRLSAMSTGQPAVAAPIHLFRAHLSGADGHRCPMTPSCSTYALQAMQRHGALKGWIMASDRLMRCGRDELKHGRSVQTRYGVRCLDPLDNNDFW